jgi:hypothetical protein
MHKYFYILRPPPQMSREKARAGYFPKLEAKAKNSGHAAERRTPGAAAW